MSRLSGFLRNMPHGKFYFVKYYDLQENLLFVVFKKLIFLIFSPCKHPNGSSSTSRWKYRTSTVFAIFIQNFYERKCYIFLVFSHFGLFFEENSNLNNEYFFFGVSGKSSINRCLFSYEVTGFVGKKKKLPFIVFSDVRFVATVEGHFFYYTIFYSTYIQICVWKKCKQSSAKR